MFIVNEETWWPFSEKRFFFSLTMCLRSKQFIPDEEEKIPVVLQLFILGAGLLL